MIELDRRMVDEYHIPLEVMMEHAGTELAELLRDQYKKARRVCVMAGSGNNGGGGLVSARILSNYGYKVLVLLSKDKDALSNVPHAQLLRLDGSVVIKPSSDFNEEELLDTISQHDVIIDALLGYSVARNPDGEIGRMIEVSNKGKTSVISLDMPSGLSPDEGVIYENTVVASMTLTLAFPKPGLLDISAQKHVGKLFLADISVPISWYREHGIKDSLFTESSTVLIK